MKTWISAFLPRLWANWISLLGSIVTTVAALAIVLFLAIEFSSGQGNPYSATLVVVILPFFFIGGLFLIPIGLFLDRRARRKAEKLSPEPEPEDDPLATAFESAINNKVGRRRLLFFAVATLLNVVIFAVAGSKAVHHMDSPQFCGTTCHTVMQPEWESYKDSKHSRVACVQCHIGPGASWAVKSKINGLKQVWGVLTGDYHRPVPSPVEHLRPSRDTCEQCHWPEKFTGNKLKVYPHFKADKDNTPNYNAMLLRVGGRNQRTGKYEGIHWHVSSNTQVEYEVLDPKRTKVGKIRVIDGGKVVAEYLPPAPKGNDQAAPVLGTRTMDCVDCHNRPTHVFDYTPALAVDHAMYAGGLDQKVPYLAEVSISVLKMKDVPRDEAETRFRAALDETYKKLHPDVQPAKEALDQAAKTLADKYRHNVYPAMNVTWGTNKTHIGHQGEGDEVIGCFRCHDTEHEKKLPDGSTQSLGQDCETCHEPLAVDENPDNFEEAVRKMLPGG